MGTVALSKMASLCVALFWTSLTNPFFHFPETEFEKFATAHWMIGVFEALRSSILRRRTVCLISGLYAPYAMLYEFVRQVRMGKFAETPDTVILIMETPPS